MFPFQVRGIFSCLIEQMDGAHFPVSRDNLPSQCHHIKGDEATFLREHGLNISRIAINHPGGGYGYRIENGGDSAVYVTDNELGAPHDNNTTDFDGFVEFCKDAGVLIHDAQYVEEDMPQKRGWGHSLVSQACELALASEVKHLILFHHDPDRTDNELDSIQEDARLRLKKNNHLIQCTAAFEGLTLALGKD
jgi:ribonuclease BN (tRNA processing enzyme)